MDGRDEAIAIGLGFLLGLFVGMTYIYAWTQNDCDVLGRTRFNGSHYECRKVEQESPSKGKP